MNPVNTDTRETSLKSLSTEDILRDYYIGWLSRHASILGRKEVFMGKAKFGIFGDGKELPQLAMAHYFKDGDFRSGYYRDQTFMMAIGAIDVQSYYAQLYAHTDVNAEPASSGRMMNGHFGTHFYDENGKSLDLTKRKNSSSDISPTAGQMPRLLGLAFASKLFKSNPGLSTYTELSTNGQEVAFGTIGDASTSEGLFYETMNAAGVLQVPMLMSVWDDGYGISVPKKYQTTKSSISELLKGLQRTEELAGYEIFRVKGWDYEGLLRTYEKATEICRTQHIPVLVHVEEVTQPQGHSTSGSHERYKSAERLEFEKEYDCLAQFKKYIISKGIADEATLIALEEKALKDARDQKNAAWKAFMASMEPAHIRAIEALEATALISSKSVEVKEIADQLRKTVNPIRQDAFKAVKRALRTLRSESIQVRASLLAWLEAEKEYCHDAYSSHLYSESDNSALNVSIVPAEYTDNSPVVDGREVLQACFDKILEREPRFLAFGEDVGFLGDVNQAFTGMQQKYGELRVMDTGIREATILGQGIGLAMRGLRPVAEIQYLDYLLYALQIMSDDLATVQYRTKGRQKCPLIVRTRGHRLEGIWHSGSPMMTILGAIRGVYVLVPRNMTQAAGFYNTLLQSDDPALMIECLNGYRLKEKIPANIDTFTVPLGVPEVLREGKDVTVVTYGSMCRIVMDAAEELSVMGVSVEVIDVQTLLPFDRYGIISNSVRKTNRVVFADEDVSGGATAFMMQKVVDEQQAYRYLDSQPVCISAKDHRPAYASDGDYFSKPSVEDVVDVVYGIMSEVNPKVFPSYLS